MKILKFITKYYTYLSIILLIYTLLNLWFSSPMLLDNPENIVDVDFNVNTDNTTNITLDKTSKAKSWLYWRLFIKNSANYKPYNEFKNTWDSSFKFKSAFLNEIHEFKNNPYKYAKNHEMHKIDRIKIEKNPVSIFYNGKFVKKIGPCSTAELANLRRNGYTISWNK